jgi:hypothetical protein
VKEDYKNLMDHIETKHLVNEQGKPRKRKRNETVESIRNFKGKVFSWNIQNYEVNILKDMLRIADEMGAEYGFLYHDRFHVHKSIKDINEFIKSLEIGIKAKYNFNLKLVVKPFKDWIPIAKRATRTWELTID